MQILKISAKGEFDTLLINEEMLTNCAFAEVGEHYESVTTTLNDELELLILKNSFDFGMPNKSYKKLYKTSNVKDLNANGNIIVTKIVKTDKGYAPDSLSMNEVFTVVEHVIGQEDEGM